MILAAIIVLISGLLALIGFNVLLLYSTSNFLLVFLFEALGPYAILINCFLIFFAGFGGLFLALGVSDYRSFKRKIDARQQIIRARLDLEYETEKAILQFLKENEGKAFTFDSLINRINHEGISEKLEGALSRLVGDRKIIRNVKDNAIYYST